MVYGQNVRSQQLPTVPEPEIKTYNLPRCMVKRYLVYHNLCSKRTLYTIKYGHNLPNVPWFMVKISGEDEDEIKLGPILRRNY